jgi:copper homeostasis protein
MNAKLEIACFNLESALIAQQGGADRIELCEDFSSGGITPNHGTVETARKLIDLDLFVMIRPRGGNFVYSETEFEQMKKDIVHFKDMKADGFVFGILNEDGSVNVNQNKELVELSKPLLCNFHRAFDVSGDFTKNLEDAIACGFKAILTSGQRKSAIEGVEQLTELVKLSNGRIVIMPGGGVRSSNLELLKSKVETPYYHSSAIVKNDRADLEEVKLLKEKLS